MPEALTEFDYLLNRFERASQAANPAELGYAEHRRALYAHVRDLERRAALASEPPEFEPVYQIKYFDYSKSEWHDATRETYEIQPRNLRRILYRAMVAESAAPGDSHA